MAKKTSLTLKDNDITKNIYTIRNHQVMFDRDLAALYQIETRALKQAVKRNIKRFPEDFMFILSEEEIESLVSQSVIPSRKELGGAKPFVFTEQGVAGLSGVLSSEKAIEMHIQIMRAFVKMRQIIQNHALLFQRIDKVEKEQTGFKFETDQKFKKVFKALEDKRKIATQGIFFDGEIFDAYRFVSDLIRSAKNSIILIDNYIDDTVLTLLTKRSQNASAIIYTKTISKQLELDIEKHNSQYPPIECKTQDVAHDRFLILDEERVYHIGASLKDLGKKWFAFSKIEKDALKILDRIKQKK